MFGLKEKIVNQINNRLGKVNESVDSTVFVLDSKWIPNKIVEIQQERVGEKYYEAELCGNCGQSKIYFKSNSATKCVLCKSLLNRTRVFVNQIKAMEQATNLAKKTQSLDWIKSQCKKMRPEEIYQFTIIYALLEIGYKVLWEIGHVKTDRYDIILPDFKLIIEVKATRGWTLEKVNQQIARYQNNNPSWTVVGTHPTSKFDLMNYDEIMAFVENHKPS
jgi:hypothetical protein